MFPNAQLGDVIEQAKEDSAEILSEQTGVIGGSKCANIVLERLEEGVSLESHYKIIAGAASVYQLKVNVLSDSKDEFQPKIEELLGSFSLS